jgi:neutral amino acid transport system substrate-binding protein
MGYARKSKVRWLIVVAVGTLGCVALAACSSAPAASSNAKQASGGGIPAGPILIGADLPLSGDLALIGKGVGDTYQAYVSQVNQEGGIAGHQVKLILTNDQNDPAIGEANVTKMVSEGVAGIIAPGFGSVTPGGMAIAMRAHVPVVDYEGDDAYQNISEYPYFFATGPTDAQDMEDLAGYLQAKGLTKVGVMSDSTPVGTDDLTQFQKYAAADHLTVTSSQSLSATATTAITQLEALRQSGAVAVALIGETDGPVIQTSFAQTGWQPAVLADVEMAASVSGSLAARTVTTCAPGVAPGAAPPASVTQVMQLGIKAGETAQKFAIPLLLSSIRVLQAAIEKADSTNGATLKNTLESMGSITAFPGYTVKLSPTDHAGWTGLDTICHATPLSPSGLPIRVTGS